LDFERARTKEQIENRQNEIIKACEYLYDQSGYEGVNFKAISEMTSFTRPSIYNYYKTKDEILLDLLKREMLKWQQQILSTMESIVIMDKKKYCTIMTELLASNDKMMKLFSILFTTLENNSEVEKLADFKKTIMDVIATFSASLDQYFPSATAENKAVFTSAFFSYVLGLYPMSNLSQKQLDAIKLSGLHYVSPNFKDMCYKGMFLLLSDL
jgi:AcrR family transcriptional regulator